MSSQEIAHFVAITSQENLNLTLKQFLEKNSLSCAFYSTIRDWRLSGSKERITGVFIDLKNLMSSEQEDRGWFHQIEAVFPICVLMPSKNSGALKVTCKNEVFDTEDAILKFLEQLIAQYPPRSFREHVRYDRYYRVLLKKKEGGASIPAFVGNISVSGVFVIVNCMDGSIKEGQKLEVKFSDLKGTPVVDGEVRFVRHWEDAQKQAPGIGIQVSENDLLVLNQILYFRL